MEVELESKHSIDSAIDYLRQSNQKVTNKCAELETLLSQSESQKSELDTSLKKSENQNKMLKD